MGQVVYSRTSVLQLPSHHHNILNQQKREDLPAAPRGRSEELKIY
jgi:hypothetical protein